MAHLPPLYSQAGAQPKPRQTRGPEGSPHSHRRTATRSDIQVQAAAPPVAASGALQIQASAGLAVELLNSMPLKDMVDDRIPNRTTEDVVSLLNQSPVGTYFVYAEGDSKPYVSVRLPDCVYRIHLNEHKQVDVESMLRKRAGVVDIKHHKQSPSFSKSSDTEA